MLIPLVLIYPIGLVIYLGQEGVFSWKIRKKKKSQMAKYGKDKLDYKYFLPNETYR